MSRLTTGWLAICQLAMCIDVSNGDEVHVLSLGPVGGTSKGRAVTQSVRHPQAPQQATFFCTRILLLGGEGENLRGLLT